MLYKDIIARNITTLASALRAAGIQSATAEYSGEGDSGDYWETRFDGPEGAEPGQVTVLKANRCWGDGADKDYQPTPTATGFGAAFEDLVWQVVAATGHDGWENGDGGGGEFTLNADGSARLDHYDNVVEQHHSEYDYEGDGTFTDEGEGA